MGAWLVDSAASRLKYIDPSKEIHTTFLDAYTPGGTHGVDSSALETPLGTSSDFAEHYIYSGAAEIYPLIGDTIKVQTEGVLSEASNVDITVLGDMGEDGGHRYPHVWYRQTIENLGAYPGYGFARSWEAGGTPLPKSGTCVALPGGTPCESDELAAPAATQLPSLDMSQVAYNTSISGTFPASGTQFTMIPASPVWLRLSYEPQVPVNLVEFDLTFNEQTGSESVLSVWWDGILLGRIDELLVPDGTASYFLTLTDTALDGVHQLLFRLDQYEAPASSVTVDNIQFGFSAIPEHPRFTSVSSFEGSQEGLSFSFSGKKGFRHNVEKSSDLLNWTTIYDATKENHGDTYLIDSMATPGANRGFYRASVDLSP